MTYTEYLQTDDWKLKRTEKLKQISSCEICKSKKTLHVHHLNYRNWFDVLPADLMVLCQTCHFIGHDLVDDNYKNATQSDVRANIIKSVVMRARNLDGRHPLKNKLQPSKPKPKKLPIVNKKKHHRSKALRCQDGDCPERAMKGKRLCDAHYLARLNQDSLNRSNITHH